jgi:hypothetical protein
VAAAGADFWPSAGLPLQALSNKSPAKPLVSKQEREKFRINGKEKGENRELFLVPGAWLLKCLTHPSVRAAEASRLGK